MRDVIRARWGELRLAPDGAPRPDAPFARGPLAARVLAKVIDGAVWAGSRVPSGLAHTLATVGGHGGVGTAPRQAQRARRQPRPRPRARPDDPVVRRTVRREIVNEAHRSADLLWALGRPQEFLASVELDGIEYAKAAAAGGSGVILAGVHLGGWEVATAVPRAELPVPTTVIVADDWLAWAIAHMRVTAGLRVLYRTAPAIRAARLLQAGEALLVLGDDGGGPSRARTRCGSWTPPPISRRAWSPCHGCARRRSSASPCSRPGAGAGASSSTRPSDRPGASGGAEEEQKVLQILADRWSELIRAHPDQWAAAYRIRWR